MGIRGSRDDAGHLPPGEDHSLIQESGPPHPCTRKVQDEPTPGWWAGPCQSVQSCEMGARGLDGDPPLMGEEMGGGAAGVCEEEGGEG